jgi:hypothetical protein
MHGHGLFNIGKLHFLYLNEYAVQKNCLSHISAVKRIIMYIKMGLADLTEYRIAKMLVNDLFQIQQLYKNFLSPMVLLTQSSVPSGINCDV